MQTKSITMKRIIRINLTAVFITLFFISLVSPAIAEVKLPEVLSSNMIFQRNEEITVWGWADKGESVKVNFNNLNRSAKASKDGKWKVVFPAMTEGGPYKMNVQGKKNSIVLENILIGDIWICSGQSNMEWSVGRSDNAEEEIRNANYPNIRLLTIHKKTELNPVDDVTPTEWKLCTSENIPGFSAVGYFFGRKVHTETGVPIGLINTSWGGTNVETWISADYMKAFPEYKEKLMLVNLKTEEDFKRAENIRIQIFEKDFKIKKGEIPSGNWADPSGDLNNWMTMRMPGLWETRNLKGVDGVVWFRQEIELSKEQAASNLVLNLGKIDDSDITWVNGTEVGNTPDSRDASRSYKIKPGVFKPGKNVIVVKVTDKGGDGGFSSESKDFNISGNGFILPLEGNWRYRLSGENLAYTHSAVGPNDIPTQLYNGMIYPLLNLKVKGAIWYQGESNASRAYRYRELFPAMINSWRDSWKQPEMPFFFVQLANYMAVNEAPVESEWAELREAQLMTLSLPKTGMAVIIDIGMANNIHPTNKQDVGLRLGLNALKTSYGKNIESMGPIYKSMEISKDKVILSFDHIGSGLKAKDMYGYVKGFAIAGADKKFHWAKAQIEGDKVVVSSKAVPSPVAVRYGWSNNPQDVNLYNNEGLPASPFRTDSWDGLTSNK